MLVALVDPIRRRIVRELYAARRELACGTIDLPVSNSTVTHHFHVLREAGLIRQYYAGTSRMNALRSDEFEQAFPGLLRVLMEAARAGFLVVVPLALVVFVVPVVVLIVVVVLTFGEVVVELGDEWGLVGPPRGTGGLIGTAGDQ